MPFAVRNPFEGVTPCPPCPLLTEADTLKGYLEAASMRIGERLVTWPRAELVYSGHEDDQCDQPLAAMLRPSRCGTSLASFKWASKMRIGTPLKA